MHSFLTLRRVILGLLQKLTPLTIRPKQNICVVPIALPSLIVYPLPLTFFGIFSEKKAKKRPFFRELVYFLCKMFPKNKIFSLPTIISLIFNGM